HHLPQHRRRLPHPPRQLPPRPRPRPQLGRHPPLLRRRHRRLLPRRPPRRPPQPAPPPHPLRRLSPPPRRLHPLAPPPRPPPPLTVARAFGGRPAVLFPCISSLQSQITNLLPSFFSLPLRPPLPHLYTCSPLHLHTLTALSPHPQL